MEPITASLIAGAANIGLGIYNRLANRDLHRLQQEIFEQQVQFNNDLSRRSRGKFTESELATIKANAEPQINAVAGNVSARLGASSPAGLALINQARQAPINAAMQAAAGQYGTSLAGLSKTVEERLGALKSDLSFLSNLKTLLKYYLELKENGANPDSHETLTHALNNLALLPESDSILKQGYQRPFTQRLGQ